MGDRRPLMEVVHRADRVASGGGRVLAPVPSPVLGRLTG
ncbi:hypothetical protein B005_3560 [Nocardiopsis alba ATCC BAA-2165]|uniref:Uncharacterized protein n=1 Tax=Nocardiopsis alba (strain ATCC BAA-2165 / BE74) TaxID=1205910 RepID=J7LAT8_NOCAA|nr:hypothetical protein B005_3560 [Nocardiopsis alba ATCC BAA-2165]